MENKTLFTISAAIITTLAECDSAVSGIVYAGLMDKITVDDFNKLLSAFEAKGFITSEPGFEIRITEKGRKLAKEIEALV
jgi:predicted transcriptional regulator